MGSLYNQYMNKNIRFLLNYLDFAGRTEKLKPYTRDEMERRLSGYVGLTSNDVVESICKKVSTNPAKRYAQCSCALFYEDGGKQELKPVLTWNGKKLPEITSSAERSWLRYVLSDPMAELFMRPKDRDELLKKLDDDGILDARYIDDRSCTDDLPKKYSEKFIMNFRQVTESVKNEAPFEVIYSNGEAGVLFPYAMLYSDEDGSFTVIAYDFQKKDISFQKIGDIAYVNPASDGFPKGKNAVGLFTDALARHRVTEPVKLEVMGPAANNPNMSNDRISHLLSIYESECYESGGKLMMDIYYYDFQHEDIIRSILALGKYVRVVSPENVRSEIIDNLMTVVSRD